MPSSSYDSVAGTTNQMVLSGFKTSPGGEPPKWNELSPMLEGRMSFAAVALDGNRVMAIGGWDGHKRFKSVCVYDNRTKEWSGDGSWPKLNANRSHCAAVMCNNKVYVFGGRTGELGSSNFSSSIEMLDLSSSSPLKWVTLEQTLSCSRSECVAVAVGNIVYIIGGGYGGDPGLSTVEAFDTKTGIIQKDQPSMVTARSGCGAVLIGNKIWVVGGYNSNDRRLKTVEYLDVDLDTGMPVGQWEVSTANMTTERYLPAVAAVGHCLVIMGGGDGNKSSLSSVEVLDTERNVCWRLPDMNDPRKSCSAVTLKESQIVVMGGHSNHKVHCSIESLLLEVKLPTCFQLSESRCGEILSIDNVKPIVKWAQLLDAGNLRHDCFKFIKSNLKALFDNDDFLAIKKEEPELWNCMLEFLF